MSNSSGHFITRAIDELMGGRPDWISHRNGHSVATFDAIEIERQKKGGLKVTFSFGGKPIMYYECKDVRDGDTLTLKGIYTETEVTIC